MWTRPSNAPWKSLLKCIWSICISVLAPFLRVLDFHPGTETVAAPFTEHVSFHIQRCREEFSGQDVTYCQVETEKNVHTQEAHLEKPEANLFRVTTLFP